MLHTRYEAATEEDLQDLFHSAHWDAMTPAERLDACQEVANRDAASMGMEPVEVVSRPMTGAQYGAYDPNTRQLAINSHVLEEGQLVNRDGQAITAPGANAETLDTVFHENSHAYDQQLREAVEAQQDGLPCNQEIIAHAQANHIDIDTLRASDTLYIPDGCSYDLQYCEAKAFNAGETKTADCFASSTSRLGEDAAYTAYRDNLALRGGFHESLSEMRDVYQDANFDKTLNEQISSRYYADGRQDGDFTYGNPASRQAANSIITSHYGQPLADANGNLIAMGERCELESTATALDDGTGSKNSLALQANTDTAPDTAQGTHTAAAGDDDSSGHAGGGASTAGSTAGGHADAVSGSSGTADDDTDTDTL